MVLKQNYIIMVLVKLATTSTGVTITGNVSASRGFF